MNRSQVARLLMTAVMLSGCRGESSTAPVGPFDSVDGAALISTSHDEYALTHQSGMLRASIPIQFANTTADTLYIVNCGGWLAPELQRNSGGRWMPFLQSSTFLCLSAPIVIAPGDVYADTLPIWGALPDQNIVPEFPTHKVNGFYRIALRNVVLHYDENRQGFGDALPSKLVVSNPFRLQVR